MKLLSIVTNDGLYPGDPIIGFNLRLGIQILDYFIPFEFFVLLHQNDKLCEKIWIILDNIIFTKVLSDLYFGKYLVTFDCVGSTFMKSFGNMRKETRWIPTRSLLLTFANLHFVEKL